jgi:bile acid:Na+ symporter, BASS family
MASTYRPSGPTWLIFGVFAGLAFPAIAEAVRPMMGVTIFVFVLGTFLRADGPSFAQALRRPFVAITLPAISMLACPILVALATNLAGLRQDLALAMVLATSAPPSSGTAAVARMLGLDATVPLTVTLLSMAMAPLTVPLFALWLGNLSLDPLVLAVRLFLLIAGAAALALALRLTAPARLLRHERSIDVLVLVALIVFVIGTMAGVRDQVVAKPAAAVLCVALAFTCNLVLQGFGILALPGTLAERLTFGLVLGNRNVGLVWAALGATVSPTTALFFAATQFPIYMTPRLIEVLARRAGRTEKPQ